MDTKMGKLGWGLIGCGDISRKRVAPALRDLENCDFVGVCRGRPALAAAFAKEFDARKSFADWKSLLADDETKAVYIATPVNQHVAQTIAAAEAGKHVLCEKPLGLTVDECDRMIDACRAHRVHLGVAYYRHFYPIIDRIKRILASGEVGKPAIVQINAFERFDPAADDPRTWLLNKAEAGGGPMFSFGCHRIELMLNVFGPIKNASGFIANIRYDTEVEDTSAAMLEFASGARGMLTVTHAAFETLDTVNIYGTAGSLHVPVLNGAELIVRTADGERRESYPPHGNIHLPLVRDFTQAVLSNRPPGVGGDVGREVARLEEIIYGNR